LIKVVAERLHYWDGFDDSARSPSVRKLKLSKSVEALPLGKAKGRQGFLDAGVHRFRLRKREERHRDSEALFTSAARTTLPEDMG
jgi:hypothetical protein